MWAHIKRAYADSGRVAIALPWLFALAAAAELIQHMVEYRAGMFVNLAAMEAAGDDIARMGFGQVKILSLILLVYWVARWQVFREMPDRSVFGDGRSALLFLGVVLLGMGMGIVQQFGGAWLSPIVPDASLLMTIGLAYVFGSIVLNIYLTGWNVGAALGNARLTIPASFRLIHGHFWWSLAFSLLMTIPLMVAHYALNILAVGLDDMMLWTVLTLDALLVGYLGLVLATTVFLIAKRAADHTGLPLAGDAEAGLA